MQRDLRCSSRASVHPRSSSHACCSAWAASVAQPRSDNRTAGKYRECRNGCGSGGTRIHAPGRWPAGMDAGGRAACCLQAGGRGSGPLSSTGQKPNSKSRAHTSASTAAKVTTDRGWRSRTRVRAGPCPRGRRRTDSRSWGPSCAAWAAGRTGQGMTGATPWISPRSGRSCAGHPAKPSTAACERPSRGISRTAGGGRKSGRADTMASAWARLQALDRAAIRSGCQSP